MNLTINVDDDGLAELAVYLRGHVHVFRFRTWRQLTIGLIRAVDNKDLDFRDVDGFAVTYFLGKIMEAQKCLIGF